MSTAADWGPSAWKFLHTVTFAYPEEPSLLEQQHADNLFQSLSVLLPCEKCREHYILEIRNNPPNTTSRATLSSWLVDIHNNVNQRLGKSVFSLRQASEIYSSLCSADCTSSGHSEHLNENPALYQPTVQLHQRNRKKDLQTQTENGLYVLCGILILLSITLFYYKFKK